MTNQPNELPVAFKAPGENEWRHLQASSESDDADEVKKARDELKQMLLASLQMQHLVVLAGSGCSITAGGPSMQDLWTYVVGEEPTAKANAIGEKVNHAMTDANIEALMSSIEAFLQVQEDKDAGEFLDEAKKIILEKCSAFLKPEKLFAHKTFIHRLSRRRARDQRLKIFTTNYDLCFEQAAGELGSVALDGFSFVTPRRYDPRFFSYDIVRRSREHDDLGSYLEGVFLLYKLHGSVNWARDDSGVIHESANPAPKEACLIYPAKGKYQQSFVEPHLESMAQYLAALREPNTCVVVVGFGFNDNHLSEPLLASVRSNPHLRLIVASRGAQAKATDQSENRFWSQFYELSNRDEDIWFISALFEEFVSLIPDLKALTPADALLRAVQGAAREQ